MAIDPREADRDRLYQQILEDKARAFSLNVGNGVHDDMLDALRQAQGRRDQDSYSMVEVQLTDGSSQTFMLKASTRIVEHLLKKMKETGYLTMWNDTDTMCIRADLVKQFALRNFTKEN